MCEVKGEVLRIRTRKDVIALRDYIASKERSRGKYRPLGGQSETFLLAKNRDIVVKKLDALLHG